MEDVNAFQNFFKCPKALHNNTIHCISINPLYTSDSLMSTFSNSEDSDEMPRNAAFYQCLDRLIYREINTILSGNKNLGILDTYNETTQVYGI